MFVDELVSPNANHAVSSDAGPQLFQFASSDGFTGLITRAGTPAANTPPGMLAATTAPAPMMVLSPTVTPPVIMAPDAIQQPDPIWMSLPLVGVSGSPVARLRRRPSRNSCRPVSTMQLWPNTVSSPT